MYDLLASFDKPHSFCSFVAPTTRVACPFSQVDFEDFFSVGDSSGNATALVLGTTHVRSDLCIRTVVLLDYALIILRNIRKKVFAI